VKSSVIEPSAAKFRKSAANSTDYKRSVLGTSALVIGALVTGGLVIANTIIRAATLNRHKRTDIAHDKTLKDSFPASDPPASQFFDIPVNRR
jgi:hypothetical protein